MKQSKTNNCFVCEHIRREGKWHCVKGNKIRRYYKTMCELKTFQYRGRCTDFIGISDAISYHIVLKKGISYETFN